MTLELLKWISCQDFILCFALSIKKYKVRTRGNHLKSIYFHVNQHHPPESHNLVANFKTLISRPHTNRGLLPTCFYIFLISTLNIEPTLSVSTQAKCLEGKTKILVDSYEYICITSSLASYTFTSHLTLTLNNFVNLISDEFH